VVIENKGKSTIKLDRLEVKYVTPDREQIEATPAKDLPYLQGPRQPNMAPTPYPWPRKKPKNALADASLDVRAFAAKVLPPGESASGFFYFQTGNRMRAQLYVSGLKDAATNQELFYFEIPLEH